MAAKAKSASKIPAPIAGVKPKGDESSSKPLTLDEKVHRIEAMGKRIDGYVQFMVKIATQAGTSTEVKERAVAAFYEKMILVERQLAHIHDELRLE